jgi:hypothetical protein
MVASLRNANLKSQKKKEATIVSFIVYQLAKLFFSG